MIKDRRALQDYYRRSGDTEILHGTIEQDEKKGFMVWTFTNDSVVLLHVYGDGEYWNEMAEEIAKGLNLNKILFATTRSPKAFCRKYGCDIVGHVLAREVK